MPKPTEFFSYKFMKLKEGLVIVLTNLEKYNSVFNVIEEIFIFKCYIRRKEDPVN